MCPIWTSYGCRKIKEIYLMKKKFWLPGNWGEIKMAERMSDKADMVPFEDVVFSVRIELAQGENGKWYWRKIE